MARLLPDALTALAVDSLLAAGALPATAESTARALVYADVRGLSSHGVSRLPMYCAQLRNGRVDPLARPVIVSDRGAAVLIDGADGLAYPACDLAINALIERARQFGSAVAGVRRSHHFGVGAAHLQALGAAGMVGLAFSNSPAAMPAWGGKRALFGTNPVAAVFPRRGSSPLTIDLSLSAVARGRIMVAARDGKPIPEGWALDKEGRPTTDARAALEGSMLPAGGVKGAMLALTVELLVCALSGAAYGFESDSFFVEEGRPTRIGQAFLAVNPGALAGNDVFFERVETLIAAMTEDPGVRLPGERRLASRTLAAREGVNVSAEL